MIGCRPVDVSLWELVEERGAPQVSFCHLIERAVTSGRVETTLFFYRGRMMRLWGKCISRDAAGDIRSVAIVLTNEKEER
ncbi:MAG: hypothetical protein MR959_07405 [Selenomonas bovis]|nr:hypothetical protein [Selenomonas bovis]